MDTTTTEIPLNPAMIGGLALILIGGLASTVFWIISIIKAFKASATVWGVLTIFLPIVGLIWLFLNDLKKTGIWWVIAIAVNLVGVAILAVAGADLAAVEK